MEKKQVIKKQILELYNKEARELRELKNAGAKIYGKDRKLLPEELIKSAYGCGHPVKYINPVKYQRVLDLGCGQGVDSYLLQKKYPNLETIGIDFSEEMLKKAKKFSPSLNFICADIERLPLKDNYFDLIISNAVFHLLPQKTPLFKEISRVLKETGEVIAADIMLERNHRPHSLLHDEFINSDGLFLYGGIIGEDTYIEYAWEGGFSHYEILEKNTLGDLVKAVEIFIQHHPLSPKQKKKLLNWAKNTRINIVTYKLSKTFGEKHLIICPQCGKTFEYTLVQDIPLERIAPKIKEELLNLKINILHCHFCNSWKQEIPQPFTISYKNTTYHIFPAVMKHLEHLLKEEMKKMEEQLFSAGVFRKQQLYFGIENFLEENKKIFFKKS